VLFVYLPEINLILIEEWFTLQVILKEEGNYAHLEVNLRTTENDWQDFSKIGESQFNIEETGELCFGVNLKGILNYIEIVNDSGDYDLELGREEAISNRN
jgi:hypothetical protein